MGKAEFVTFNGDWLKDCSRCKAPFGAESKSGLEAFFSRDKSRPDGFDNYCKGCRKSVTAPFIVPRFEKDPVKREARLLFRQKVAQGLIKKRPCSECGASKSEGHHPDYSKPLDVIWLCRKHHAALHARERLIKPRTDTYNLLKTHCKKGHEFTTENTTFCRSGKRSCRTCQSNHRTKSRYKRMAETESDAASIASSLQALKLENDGLKAEIASLDIALNGEIENGARLREALEEIANRMPGCPCMDTPNLARAALNPAPGKVGA